MTTAMVLGSGALAGVGLWLALLAWAGPSVSHHPQGRTTGYLNRHVWARMAGCASAGVLAWILTGWPVAAFLAAMGVWWLPGLLGPDREHEHQVARITAVASWIEQIRDLISSASGLQQAIVTTAPIAPEHIRPQVQHLARALQQGQPPEQALRDFQETVDVPLVDLAVASLERAIDRYAADLAAMLSDLADSTREQAAMLARIARSRARTRTSMRIIIATALSFPTVLLIANPSYLQPYDTAIGQLVLALVGAIMAISLAGVARIARVDLGPRVLRLQQSAQHNRPQPGATS